MSGGFHALIDSDLCLPQHPWGQDRERCRAAGIPDEVGYRPQWRIGLELLGRSWAQGVRLAWLVADEDYGQCHLFRQEVARLGIWYVVDVPRNSSCWWPGRCLDSFLRCWGAHLTPAERMNKHVLEQASPTRIHSLFGLFPRALSELLAVVLPLLVERRRQAQQRQPDRQRAVGGGRIRRLAPFQEVLLTLRYLRHNVSHTVVGALFGVSADTSENTFHEVLLVLQEACPSSRWDAQKHWQKGQPSWQPTAKDRLLIDSFETPIRRPSDDARQRRTYSGKKKRHTLKTQVVTDAQGEIVEIDAGHRGPQADFRLYEERGIEARYPEAEKIADKAYQSAQHPTLHTPHKKPKGGALTPQQREENRQLAQQRIYVEHGIRRLKGWRILRDDYRLAVGLFATVAQAVVGLVQMGRLLR